MSGNVYIRDDDLGRGPFYLDRVDELESIWATITRHMDPIHVRLSGDDGDVIIHFARCNDEPGGEIDPARATG